MSDPGGTDPRRPSRGSRLVSAATEQEVIATLHELALEVRRPWGRVEVLRYLPARWHALAEAFFEGNALRTPQTKVPELSDPEDLSLTEALRRAALRDAPTPPRDPEPLEPDSLRQQLESDPPEGPDDIVGQVLAAVREEALAVGRETPSRYQLTQGRCIGARGSGFAYMFRWSSAPDLHEPGELQLSRQLTIPARITGQGGDDKHFELVVDTFLGATVDRAVFRVDPTYLLRALFAELKEGRETFPQCELARSLFSPPEETRVEGPDVAGLNSEQVVALRTALAAKRAYVWGPPGTGKTTTLGRFIREAAAAGKRILVLSPYNIAVDEALIAATQSGDWKVEEIVRFGRVSDKVRSIGITLEQLLERRAQDSGLLDECRAFCAAAARECGAEPQPVPRTVQLCLEQLGELIISLGRKQAALAAKMKQAVQTYRALFRAPEESILGHARVIGTTVTLAYISPKIHARLFDYIVVDEASVLKVPEAIVLALRATGKLAFFGDPQQLPSIVRVSTESAATWIRRNPFDLAGIRSPKDARGSCVMLEVQHRMAAPIRALVSTKFYAGRLRDGRIPGSGRLILVDTSATTARATTRYAKRSASMENIVHRTIASEFIRAVSRRHPEKRILILSPFAAQRRGYDREPNSKNVRTARFATVHASQGTESEVVVLDFVFAPGRRKSAFLDSLVRPEFRNLLNVGLSRAREQLVLLAHTRAIQAHYRGTLLAELIEYFEEHGEVVRVPGSLEMVRLFRGVMEGGDPSMPALRHEAS